MKRRVQWWPVDDNGRFERRGTRRIDVSDRRPNVEEQQAQERPHSSGYEAPAFAGWLMTLEAQEQLDDGVAFIEDCLRRGKARTWPNIARVLGVHRDVAATYKTDPAFAGAIRKVGKIYELSIPSFDAYMRLAGTNRRRRPSTAKRKVAKDKPRTTGRFAPADDAAR